METVGNLIDKLTVTNLKIWHLEDLKRDSSDDKLVANATRKTNTLNQLRNDLIQEIDETINKMIVSREPVKLYGQGSTKVYGKQS